MSRSLSVPAGAIPPAVLVAQGTMIADYRTLIRGPSPVCSPGCGQ